MENTRNSLWIPFNFPNPAGVWPPSLSIEPCHSRLWVRTTHAPKRSANPLSGSAFCFLDIKSLDFHINALLICRKNSSVYPESQSPLKFCISLSGICVVLCNFGKCSTFSAVLRCTVWDCVLKRLHQDEKRSTLEIDQKMMRVGLWPLQACCQISVSKTFLCYHDSTVTSEDSETEHHIWNSEYLLNAALFLVLFVALNSFKAPKRVRYLLNWHSYTAGTINNLLLPSFQKESGTTGLWENGSPMLTSCSKRHNKAGGMMKGLKTHF